MGVRVGVFVCGMICGFLSFGLRGVGAGLRGFAKVAACAFDGLLS